MSPNSIKRLLLAFAVPLALAACGGGESPSSVAAPLLDRIGSETPQQRSLAAPERAAAAVRTDARALAAVDVSITVTQLFDWAQKEFETLFPAAPANVDIPALLFGGNVYTIRYFPQTNNYLGVTQTGAVYGLGRFTNDQLVAFGNIADYKCLVAPTLCTPNPPPTGTLNECADPAYASLPTGYRVELVYQLSGSASGEQSSVSVVEGPGTFEGQSATRLSNVVTGSTAVEGFQVSTVATVDVFQQRNSAGLWKTLGSNSTIQTGGISIPGFPPFPGSTSKSKTVFNPPVDEVQFTLTLGQSVTQTTTSTTTFIEPVLPLTTVTDSISYSFVAKEPKTVLGRTYNTCRYTTKAVGSPDTTVQWVLIGRGVVVATETVTAQGTERLELKSGKVNGTAL